MSTTKIEFAVQMTCNSCVDSVKRSLADDPAIKNVDVTLERGSVVVETTLPTLEIQKRLENTGKKVVVRGYAGSCAAVAILDTGEPNIQGVVRFVQVTPSSCIIDGTVDGLSPAFKHYLTVHECGDISRGCQSVGSIFNPVGSGANGRIYGSLREIIPGNNGRADFRFEDYVLKVSDIIGRSLVVGKGDDNNRLVCGIIARSAGLFENPKTICACDGLTIWDEQRKPGQAAL